MHAMPTPLDFFGLVNMYSNTASIFAIFIAALSKKNHLKHSMPFTFTNVSRA
jgi:hypothetical protein